VTLNDCNLATPTQQWAVQSGTLRPGGSTLCLAHSAGATGDFTKLTVQACAPTVTEQP
jgi:hypothetical protein